MTTAVSTGCFVPVSEHTPADVPGPQLYVAEVRGYGAELMHDSFNFLWAPLGVWVPVPNRPGWRVRVTNTQTYPRDRAGAWVEVRQDTPEKE